MRPKYALPEIERRWIVDPGALPDLARLPRTDIRDRYLVGTRLRLRQMVGEADSQRKLGKKYGDRIGFAESITNIYLTRDEYALLSQLPAAEVVKARYRLEGGSLDVYARPGLPVLFSVEFASERDATAYRPPAFVRAEVTLDNAYTGYALAHRSI